MRLNLILLTAIITTSFFLTSCEKNDPAPTPGGSTPPTFSDQFSLTLNGENINIPGTSYNTSSSFDDITIYAWQGDHFFNVYLKDTMKAGTTYPLTESIYSPRVIYRDTNNMSYIYKSISGSMTITMIDTVAKKIQGTYNCVLRENFIDSTHTITNGKFGVYYP